ncbi:3-oxoacyl-ACP synthase III family protein [Streptomyces chartreusis]|uniref:3-oxoacyl-ACP synthase III family protein n=1 Tax=Streptomyces chartreusis TaxID=1969 RepID=UPI00382A629D
MSSAALRGISLAVPSTIRSNEDLARNYPQTYQKILDRGSQGAHSSANAGWYREMGPYMSDPFRGAVRRHVLAGQETSLDVQHKAAMSCLEAADCGLDDIDLMIVSATVQSQPGAGDAAYLAERIGLRRPAINIESMCSGALVSLKIADALIVTGQHERVLIVASCNYSSIADPADAFAWTMGDAVGAMLVTPAETSDEGIRAVHVVDTLATNNTFYCDHEIRADGSPGVRMRANRRLKNPRPVGDVEYADLAQVQEGFILESTAHALKRAGKSLSDVDFLVVNTPMAWYADFACRVLGIDRSRCIDVFPELGNVGVALPVAGAVRAAAQGRIATGDTVLFFSTGSVSTAVAAVVEWGQVAVADNSAAAGAM